MVSRRDRDYLDWYHSQEGKVSKVGIDGLKNAPTSSLRDIYDSYYPNQPMTPASSTYTCDHRNRMAKRNKLSHIMLQFKIYYMVFVITHITFGIIEHSMQLYYAAIDYIVSIFDRVHLTSELVHEDVLYLKKVPRHLSVILTLHTAESSLAVLMNEVAELAAWSACAGITQLSVYEETGILKSHMSALYPIINVKLSSYYRSPSQQPSVLLFAPKHPVEGTVSIEYPSLKLLLLSSADGRESVVEVTKSLAQMVSNGQLLPTDITQNIVDAMVTDITVKPLQNSLNLGVESFKFEPDLLLIFGPSLRLHGYPPWQIRLTEMYCTGERYHGRYKYGGAVEYREFLRGLRQYAGAEMRVGR